MLKKILTTLSVIISISGITLTVMLYLNINDAVSLLSDPPLVNNLHAQSRVEVLDHSEIQTVNNHIVDVKNIPQQKGIQVVLDEPHNEARSIPVPGQQLKMDELVFLAPKTDTDGNLIGAEFGPSSDLLFDLGIDRQDTITFIDHYDMTDETATLALIKRLPQLRNMTLTTDRDGESSTYYIDLEEIELTLEN
ncbi:hypothetical protein [Vibrio agarivorans]|uniref:Uncharacterized protein n=1 Tax=Vibrio agarivorans TaxID=153622 RepID=A0ABT7Y628_9VIBR|nr:hypothetical protein [Vibrio agarivorans]MDN2483506.1 hypothetical protein [Vibrio agarivorans]